MLLGSADNRFGESKSMHFERHALFWTATALLFAYIVQLLAPVLLPFVDRA